MQAVFVWLLTWPYHWTFQYYILEPIRRIAEAKSDDKPIASLFENFKERKLRELDFVKVASTLSAAACVGALTWPPPTRPLWLAPACWYCSLLLAIAALILAAQQNAILTALLLKSKHKNSEKYAVRLSPMVIRKTKKVVRTVSKNSDLEAQKGDETVSQQAFRVSKNMVFVWQNPLMLMSWSWVMFTVAITCYVAAPLANCSKINGEKKAAMVYFTLGIVVVMDFAWCSFWLYRGAAKAGANEMISNT